MSFPRVVHLLPGILASLLAGAAVHAQIHEQKPVPRLEEGILFDANLSEPERGKQVPAKDIGTGDFSIVLDVAINSLGNLHLYSHSNDTNGWYLESPAEGKLVFTGYESEGKIAAQISTPASSLAPNRRSLIVVSVKRNARQPETGIWVNGVEVASGAVPPVRCTRADALVTNDQFGFESVRARVYDRALTRPEILELFLRSSQREEAQTSGSAATSTPNAQQSMPPHVGSYEFPKPKHPAPPPNGPRFIPQPDETIALIGGTEAVALAESGELEALLLMAFPQTRFHFRSLAWEGDTVFKQDRPMNFGSLEQQLRRVNAGAVFVMFGRQECLDSKNEVPVADDVRRLKSPGPDASPGTAGQSLLTSAATGNLDEFRKAFERLLATVEKVTPNIVVIGPVPFEKKEPPLPDLSEMKDVLKSYSFAMEEAARKRGVAYGKVVFGKKSYFFRDTDPTGWTTNGVTLSKSGTLITTWVLANYFGWTKPIGRDWVTGLGNVDTWEALPKEVAAKNRLWHDYWRPSNWAFLHGDRTNQPSSRDPVNPQIRFFPAEQEKYLPLIKDAEDKVFQLVQEAQKKLP